MPPAIEELRLHGHRVTYRTAGSGPVLVLIHGITSTSETWDGVIPLLARDHLVIAPDLLGHGMSAKPRGDYSMGAFASGIRDVLSALGHDRATIVGHSLGGGIAMQFAYQFPERVERLGLVASGGLGRGVNAVLRAAALPGAELVLPLLVSSGVLGAGATVARVLDRIGLRAGPDLTEMARGFASLADIEARQAFVHTVRGAIDPGGQRVSARDRLYLAEAVPTLIVWGERDPMIPVRHGYRAHREIPGSRLEIFEHAGHFPHRDDPLRFVAALESFLAETSPAHLDADTSSELMRRGPLAASA